MILIIFANFPPLSSCAYGTSGWLNVLSVRNKKIPSKFKYDLNGSKYFEKITRQPEYYPTRKEKEILNKIRKEIPKLFKGKLSFVELGSGAIDKIKILINKNVKFYIPLDISFDFINFSSNNLELYI